MTPLRAGVTYEATDFPFAVRVTPPDSTWAGAQWKQNKFNPYEIELRHLTCSTNPAVCAAPYFGWVAIGRGVTDRMPAARADPRPRRISAHTVGAATVEGLRTRGHGARYEPATKIELAGFPGVQFDGEVVGPKHVFVPFSPPTTRRPGSPMRSRWTEPGTPSGSTSSTCEGGLSSLRQQPGHVAGRVRGIPPPGRRDPPVDPLPERSIDETPDPHPRAVSSCGAAATAEARPAHTRAERPLRRPQAGLLRHDPGRGRRCSRRRHNHDRSRARTRGRSRSTSASRSAAPGPARPRSRAAGRSSRSAPSRRARSRRSR